MISSFLASRPSRLRESPTHFLERMDLTEAQRHGESEIWKWFSRSHLFLLRVLRVFARDQRTSMKEWISQRHRESEIWKWFSRSHLFLLRVLRVFARVQGTSLKGWISQRHRESKMMEMVLAISSFLGSRPSRLRESPTAPETFDDRFQKATVKRSRLTGIPDGPIKGSNADRFIEQVDVLHRHANDHEGEEHSDQNPQRVTGGGGECLHRRLGSLLIVRCQAFQRIGFRTA